MSRAMPDRAHLQLLKDQLHTLSPRLVSLGEKGTRLSESQKYYLTAYGLDFSDLDGLSYGCGWLRGVPGSEAQNIFCQQWQHDESTCNDEHKGTFFVLHGYFDHGGLYGHLIRFLLQQGYNVVAFDQPGHGLSEGASGSIDCFSRYTKTLNTVLNWGLDHQLPQPFHLVGQSMGGAVITEFLLEKDSAALQKFPLKKVVLLAPLIRPVMWRLGRIQFYIARTFLKSIPRSRSENSHDEEFLDFLAAEPLQSKRLPVDWVSAMNTWINHIEVHDRPCPLDILMVQGQDDGTVDWKHNMPVYDRLYRSIEKLFIPEGKHHLVNESKQIRQKYFDWLAERL